MNNSGIFVFSKANELHQLRETPFETEDDFQSLLSDYPDLLPGDEIDPDKPRRWLLVSREVGIADSETSGGRWAVDHLFVDQDAIPTFVEVKRRGDTRLRREVVGQILEYAAHALAYWPEQQMADAFRSAMEAQGQDPDMTLAEFLGNDEEPSEFWSTVWANLQAGRIRLVILADHIPRELSQIIEFLNHQMSPAEILGVELRHYAGEGLRTLVPRLIGRPALSARRKRTTPIRKVWGRNEVLAVFRSEATTEVAEIAEELLDWATECSDTDIRYGTGQNPSFGIVMRSVGCSPVFFYCSEKDSIRGTIQLEFLMRFPPFDNPAKRAELMKRFLEIDPDLDETNLNRFPSFRGTLLADPKLMERFKDTISWVGDQLRADR